MSNKQFDKQSKALREFFIFTYFKTKECENNHNDLIQNIIKKAYNDATMMCAYNTLISKELFDKSYSAYCKATKLIMEEIYNVKVNITSQESFDKWHEKTCGRIKDRYYKRSLAHKRETKGVKYET